MSAFSASAGWQPAKLMGGTKPLPGCVGGQCNNDVSCACLCHPFVTHISVGHARSLAGCMATFCLGV